MPPRHTWIWKVASPAGSCCWRFSFSRFTESYQMLISALLSYKQKTLSWFNIALAVIGGGCFVRAQSQPASVDDPIQLVFLLPVGFKGWVCTDFGVPGAPPLPREGNALIIRA